MKIIEVNNQKTRNEFHEVGRIIYKDDKNWVCPLDQQIDTIFDPEQNVFHQRGESIRWILKDKKGKLIGRIGSFYDKEKGLTYAQPTGGTGFFECIDNQEAASLLFETAKKWLKEKGFEAMDGPINFGENNNNWGLLVEGFTQPGYGMPYHKKYYQSLFENYGFQLYFKQFSYHLDIRKPFPERFWKIADWVSQKPGYSFKHFTFKDADKFIDDLITIYNETWASFKKDFTPMNPADAHKVFIASKAILEEKFIWFAYLDGKPISFLIMFPDVNQIFKHLGGKLNFWNKLKFIYYKKTKTITRARVWVMGVRPNHQRSGIESGVFRQMQKVMDSPDFQHYKEIELSWVGDFNPKMHKLYESVGGVLAKQHITYRYLFDRTKEFERYPLQS